MFILDFYISEDAQSKTRFIFKISANFTILIIFELRKRFKDVFVVKYDFLKKWLFFRSFEIYSGWLWCIYCHLKFIHFDPIWKLFWRPKGTIVACDRGSIWTENLNNSRFFPFPETLESPVLANFKITHFVQDFVSKNSLRKSVELSKSSNDFEKNLHCIFIFFRPILMIDLTDTITVF